MELLTVGIWVLCALFTNNQAKKKGLNVGLWTVIGLVFGIFGVMASLIVSPKNNPAQTVAGSSNRVGGATPNSFSGGMVGGAIGATAATRINPGQQNAAEKIQEVAQQYMEEKEEESSESEPEDFDFEV